MAPMARRDGVYMKALEKVHQAATELIGTKGDWDSEDTDARDRWYAAGALVSQAKRSMEHGLHQTAMELADEAMRVLGGN